MTSAPHDQGEHARRVTGQLIRMLAKNLESRGLAARLETSDGDGTGDVTTEEIVVTNPAAPERGQVSVYDDGSMTWDYFERQLDRASAGRLLEEITSTLRAAGGPGPARAAVMSTFPPAARPPGMAPAAPPAPSAGPHARTPS
jgi:hypothetical protein